MEDSRKLERGRGRREGMGEEGEIGPWGDMEKCAISELARQFALIAWKYFAEP